MGESLRTGGERWVLRDLLVLALEGRRVDAVPLVRRPGAVVEYVSQMGITLRAENLSAAHEKTLIRFSADVFARDRLGKTGPARAGIKLGVGVEERRNAADAGIGTRILAVVVLPRESALGALLARDTVLLRCEQLAPFLVALTDLVAHRANL